MHCIQMEREQHVIVCVEFHSILHVQLSTHVLCELLEIKYHVGFLLRNNERERDYRLFKGKCQ